MLAPNKEEPSNYFQESKKSPILPTEERQLQLCHLKPSDLKQGQSMTQTL